MTAPDRIAELIKAVEAGEVSMSQCASAFPSESAGGLCTWHRVWAAYNGSLDAALALHNALLPGWVFDVTNDSAFVMRPQTTDYPWGDFTPQSLGQSDIPARAWLLAILRAKEAMRLNLSEKADDNG